MVAAPTVFWLFRRRQGPRVAGTQHDERQEVTSAAAKDDAPVHFDRAPVPEAPLPPDGAVTDTSPEGAPSPEPQLPCVAAASSKEKDVVAEPAFEVGTSSTAEDDIEAIEYSAVESVSGQAKLVHEESLSPETEQPPASHANGESKEPAISEMDGRSLLPGGDTKEPVALPVLTSPTVPEFEAGPEENIAAEEEPAVSVLDHPTAEGNVSHDVENDVALAAPEPEPVTSCPTIETGHPEEPVQAATEIPSGVIAPFAEVPEQVAANGGGEPAPPAEETKVPRAEAGDFIGLTAANDESALDQPATAGVGVSSEEPAPAEIEHTELEDIEEAGPSRYRPPQQRQARRSPARAGRAARGPRFDSVLEIRVRLTLDRFGFCQISLLPERKPDMEDEITVKAGAMRLTLAAQEDWYCDLYFDDIGERLRQGIRLGGLLAEGRRVQWQLSGGRDIYVLASHPSASGFVSVPRLALGRKHAVLCTTGVLEQAEAVLQQAGCKSYTKLDTSHGVPDGWTGLTGVLPENALTLDPGIDPFYALKPPPEIDINLEGGLLFHDAAWLSGYPPQIRVTGQTTGVLKVLIDGNEAHAADGSYTAAGFDAPGQHLVECEGLSCSRSYSIEEPAESWEQWAAYAFSGADVCGPLVTLRPEERRNRLFTVPMSNPLLLGAEPGQVFRCSHRNVANWQGFVPFEVVWALPAQPLICDKKTSRILCFSSAPIATANRNANHPLGWCSAILDAARKGLRIEDRSPESRARWIEYRKAARNIWRGRR